mgnify:CR=1 FL=1
MDEELLGQSNAGATVPIQSGGNVCPLPDGVIDNGRGELESRVRPTFAIMFAATWVGVTCIVAIVMVVMAVRDDSDSYCSNSATTLSPSSSATMRITTSTSCNRFPLWSFAFVGIMLCAVLIYLQRMRMMSTNVNERLRTVTAKDTSVIFCIGGAVSKEIPFASIRGLSVEDANVRQSMSCFGPNQRLRYIRLHFLAPGQPDGGALDVIRIASATHLTDQEQQKRWAFLFAKFGCRVQLDIVPPPQDMILPMQQVVFLSQPQPAPMMMMMAQPQPQQPPWMGAAQGGYAPPQQPLPPGSVPYGGHQQQPAPAFGGPPNPYGQQQPALFGGGPNTYGQGASLYAPHQHPAPGGNPYGQTSGYTQGRPPTAALF